MTANKVPLLWSWQPFHSLTTAQLYEVMVLRQRVFVVEQACAFQDADGIDPQCWHGLGRMPDGELAAYARIVPPGLAFMQPSIGRVVTSPTLRGVNAGRQLMEQAMVQIRRLFPSQVIQIGAQVHLQGFYNGFGFETIGEPYDEDGIMHVHMVTKAGDAMSVRDPETTKY
ncbi:GNAT family N-acetyltransferase [Glaciimonas soli]|uniref:GNAT family N-acetyltransferase n=1 Tax=Glaciimonas soli TaxID=2590999 RepID=A0A843YV68_9BURK|nr:GNAT family N-acetyltransferase [Glaciimonas soli]MQR01594.1 GNAT family N-acetyltransferase [Glaciimonas soli]